MTQNIAYREEIELFAPELAAQYPRMADSFSDHPVENAGKIKQFILTAGYLDIGSTGHSKDVFTGEDTGLRSNIRSDGDWSWSIDLAYYIDRYNLRLPDEFVAHALSA